MIPCYWVAERVSVSYLSCKPLLQSPSHQGKGLKTSSGACLSWTLLCKVVCKHGSSLVDKDWMHLFEVCDWAMAVALRLLMERVGPLITRKGVDFKVEYVTSIRNFTGTLPKISSLSGAYRRRTIKDQKVIPHSFTFIRRESNLVESLIAL